ncbi:MAG TPA: SpoIID/LytB domain-containing protein [Egibacteraceae bacterium]|nr:SpoIID/LytB domain-containing protein [Egibacteraceae bacterium]
MGSTLQAGIGLAIVGVLLAAAAVTVSMAHQAAPAAAPASPMADFQPREPARAPTEQPMRAARPAPALRLTGRGEGHGVGLSQWGAYSMAREGSDHETILRHYYTDVQVGSHAAASGEIRVNLFHGNPAVGDPGRVRLQSVGAGVAVALAPGAAPHSMPAGTEWTVAHDGGFVLLDGNGAEIDRGPGPVAVNYPAGGPAALRLPQSARSGARHEGGLNRGHLEITAGGGVLRPVVALRMDDYLVGVDEMPGGWPVEALKAQAVAARTFAAGRVAAGLRPECACHVSATIADQVYVGYGHEGAPGATGWRSAVTSTGGKVLSYDGALIEAVYSAAHAGSSEHAEDSWAFDAKTFPYLRSVADPWVNDLEVAAEYRRSVWAHGVDHAVLADLVGLATVARVEVASRTPGGSPRELAVSGWDGNGQRVEDVRFRGQGIGVAAAELFLTLRARDTHPPSQQIAEFGFVAFPDVPGVSPHAYNIAAIAEQGIAAGDADGSFAPDDPVRRDQMATFMARALGLEPVEEDHFADVPAASVHRPAINAVALAGIATGFGDGRFGPAATVTREQMATFLARAFGVPPPEGDHFGDIAGSVHRQAINAVAEEGIAAGCAPIHFCPGDPVTRGQMASFLARGVGYGW